jgi:hypothetical protein
MITEVNCDPEESGVLTVSYNGKVVGVVSTLGLSGVKTVRLAFTRSKQTDDFRPLQGQCVEVF